MIEKDDSAWQAELTAEEYKILRKKGTEMPFTGKYWNAHQDGTYLCKGCGEKLFASGTKFDSLSGWPSFYAPLKNENIAEVEDRSLFGKRTEVTCSNCNGHLGHVFNDGPHPTGLRYCINSAALKFEAQENMGD